MNLSHVEISTNRLIIKPITMEYKENIFSEFTEEITTYTYPRSAKTIAETELFINESIKGLKNGTNLQLIILAKKEQEFLGCAGLHNLDKQPELGIWLKKNAHGNNYGLEAITAIKQWADKNIDCEYFIYPVDRRNIASRKIPEALGGEVIKTYEKVNLSGNVLHILEYRIKRRKFF
ncbi:MAG TPA: N-acetyltransferase [Cyanobacteria bacterium UBA8543]|nr:N-acetyltransferase [Cyanobacteria bacterium UBA8543]